MPFTGKRSTGIRLAAKKPARRPRKAISAGTFVFLGIVGILTLAIGGILYACHAIYMRTVPYAQMVLEPLAGIWFVYALPIALGLGVLLIDSLTKVYRGAAPSRPSVKSLKVAAAIFVCVFGILAIFGVRKHVRITDSGIADQRALAWREHFYAYSEIQDVALARYWISGSRYSSGHVSSGRGVFVFFKDGSRWSPKDADLPASQSREIAALISERAGRQIVMSDTVIDTPAGVTARRAIIVLLVYSAIIYGLIWAGRRRVRLRSLK